MLALAAAAALAVRSDGAGSDVGSRRIERGADLDVERVPPTWRITYRVTTGSGDGASTVTEVAEARRPFESRLETYAGDDSAGDPRTVQVSSFGRTRLAGPGLEPSVVAAPIGVGLHDLRIDPLLPAATDAGLLERREHREVAGRICQVLRSDGPLRAGPLTPPAEGTYADSCVDADGLVLEQVVVVDGDRVLHQVATEVEVGVDLDDDRFRTGEITVPADQGGGSVLRIRPGSIPPGPFWVLDEADVPAGFEPCGRFSVVPPQPHDLADPLRSSSLIASATDVWVDGPDLLIVDQGATLGGAPPFVAGGGEPVDLGPLGEGEILLDAGGNEVRVLLGGGGYLSVQGTLPPADLAAVARSLRQVEGDELVVDRNAPIGCAGAS